MTDLTGREILDAIHRGMEETWRRLDERKAAEARPKLWWQGRELDRPAANDNVVEPRS
jgi:hypothetical protein